MKVSLGRLIGFIQALCLALLCIVSVVLTSRAQASDISRGFNSASPLPSGTVVSIQKDNPESVTPTDSTNEQYVVGVVSTQGDSLLELKNNSTNISVTSNGPSQVFVSDLGGPIRKGDPLAASPIGGVAMRFTQTTNNQKVLGTATNDFDPNSTGVKSLEVESLDNKTVRVGLLPSYISITDKGQWISSSQSSSSLARAVSRISGRSVTNLQALTGSLIFITSVVAGSIILFGGVRGSTASLGRNPLASQVIYRNMLRVLATTVGIVLAGSILTFMVFSL